MNVIFYTVTTVRNSVNPVLIEKLSVKGFRWVVIEHGYV